MSDQQYYYLSWTDPVRQAQQVFRTALTALARPARKYVFAPCPPTSASAADKLPFGLSPELAALALSLCDNETTVWLASGLDTEEVRIWFRFHCSTVLVDEPGKARFAFVPRVEDLPELHCFCQGDAEYPDRSTTIFLGCAEITESSDIRATGPGIKGSCPFVCRMPESFVGQWQANHDQFPRGVDMLLCGSGYIVGLPRTTCLIHASNEVKQCM